jgi:riboflavin synthase
MFSGIIESLGEIVNITKEKTNVHFVIKHSYTDIIYIDQSIAHNGCCLTVVNINEADHLYTVTAIDETLSKTNLGQWQIGSKINLERCIKADARLDGHFVQGHVDSTVECLEVIDKDGSWIYKFQLPKQFFHLVVDKGSIAINGTSLTLILDENPEIFSVAIIPYTYEHTNFHQLKAGDLVNIEFDILGKYIARLNNGQSPLQSSD